MNVKISTKPKFHAISIRETMLAANMTAAMAELMMPFLKDEVKNVVLNLKDIQNIDSAAAQQLFVLQELFKENKASFLICELPAGALIQLREAGIADVLNMVPTESEASDMVLMDEIERELMG